MVVNKEQEKSQSGQNRMFSSETNGRFKLKRGVVRLNQSETEPTTRIILSNTVGSRLEGNRDRQWDVIKALGILGEGKVVN